ncbi:hypothetical protein LR48_Vigan01g083200 [Vigna angularis]|uniref:WAT1-related protein n=1 Tax=Phaseolus angularis TaxID=3914 RepID=A0A0L9TLF2_PHAAN|nr:hypothetical protein LR48_Vigan01g083200 [Vigna angularis]
MNQIKHSIIASNPVLHFDAKRIAQNGYDGFDAMEWMESCWNMDDLNKVEGTGNVKAVLLMILLQTLYAVVNIMLKIVADDGMSLSILVAYRFIFATAFIVPLALIVERKHLQDVTGQVAFQGFLCGLFGGSLLQGLYVKSLALTSAVYVSAMLNLVPGVTYLMSISLGLEKANLGTAGGMAKLVGTLTGIGGAMIITFYKGRKLCLWSSHIGFLHHAPSPDGAPTGSLLWGCILAFGAALSYSVWLIIQVQLIIAFNSILEILQKVC